MLLIITGPSGAGKTTLCQHVLDTETSFSSSISVTTRAPRGTEKDGVEYHFVEEPRFMEMIQENLFAEFALVHGNYYGTTLQTIDEAHHQKKSLVFDIDYQGAISLAHHYPEAVTVMALPPSMEVLRQRLSGRGTDSAEVVNQRMENAKGEMSHLNEFTYAIVNKSLGTACFQLSIIIEAELCKTSRMELFWMTLDRIAEKDRE